MPNKFISGQYKNNEKTRGWFVGSFLENGNPCKTDKVEVQYKEQPAGHVCKKHYHEHKNEILLIISGKAIFTVDDQKVELVAGDYLYVDKGCATSGEFVEDTKYFTIHAPSIPTDKVTLET